MKKKDLKNIERIVTFLATIIYTTLVAGSLYYFYKAEKENAIYFMCAAAAMGSIHINLYFEEKDKQES